MRIRNPKRALKGWVRDLIKDPEKYTQSIAQLSKQEGYQYIREAVLTAEAKSKDLTSQIHLLLLLQPDWEWRQSFQDRSVFFFGLNTNQSGFIPKGWYVTGFHETGDLEFFGDEVLDPTMIISEICDDPRGLGDIRSSKTKVYRKHGKYFVVAVGRVVDLVHEGFDRAALILTQGKGYFKRFPAYAIIHGPFEDSEQAREVRDLESLHGIGDINVKTNYRGCG
jgi:hypothetical protein